MKCLKNQYQLIVLFLLIFLTHAIDLGWKCKSDDDCTTLNSNCVNNHCTCKSGFVFNPNMTSCLKVASSYGELCEDTVQCSAYLMVGASCELEPKSGIVPNPSKNICVCGKGYHYLHGRCYRSSGLGEKCRSDDECYVNSDFEASSCKNGTCVCSVGFYQREYRTCRRAANAVGDECTVNIDCKFSENATCVKFKCELNKKSNLLSQEFPKILPKQNFNSSLGKVCDKDQDCQNNTICGPDLKCICKQAFFNSSGGCIPELGEPCSKSESSKANDFICRNGFWSCKGGKVASKNNQICRKVTRVKDNTCVYNEQCYVFGPDAFCRKKCFCNENSHFVEKEQFCWANKGIGESCKIDNDCHIQGSKLSCKNYTCGCPDGTLPNSDKTLCLKIPTGINATCKKPEDCVIKNGTCILGTCRCIKDNIPLTENACVKISSYGNKCNYHIQCNATLRNGICSQIKDKVEGQNSTSGICTCAPNYQYRNGNCFVKKYLGNRCQNESECYLEKNIDRVKCTNGICTCDREYKKSTDMICTKSGSTVIHIPIWIGLIATVCSLLMF